MESINIQSTSTHKEAIQQLFSDCVWGILSPKDMVQLVYQYQKENNISLSDDLLNSWMAEVKTW